MIRRLLVAGALALGVTAVIAQPNVIEQRQKLMKDQWAAARPIVVGMIRNNEPFNLEQVHAALRTLSQSAKQIPGLFPDNSKTGGETKALPAVWESKAEFTAAAAKFDQDAQAALAAIKDAASMRAEFPKVVRSCDDSCHNKFRKPLT